MLPSAREVGNIRIRGDIDPVTRVRGFDFAPQGFDRIRPALGEIHHGIKAHIFLCGLRIKAVDLQNSSMRERNVLDRMAHLRGRRIFGIVGIDADGADADAGLLFDALLDASGQRVNLFDGHRVRKL